MKDAKFKAEISNQLKSLRKKRGLSLDATAQLTGVSKAMLGQIERRESSPTIATLWKISSGLDSSFSAFFSNDPQLQQSEKTFPCDAHMQVNTLFPFQSDTNIEVFEITLTDRHQQLSSPHQVGVIEHVHVISGKLKLMFNDTWHTLTAGESVRFYADQPHGYEAVTETVIFHNIVSYPII
ncbi:XRE family transcriptional regulator [Vibrio sp. qd031]|uniref:helix-turn-helix domain-containing protein n=1 Tax=Vibrio sp. qd031 TaxID=1603038 RepID=UPI000A0F5982|nr:XRE family transcriptional regulator [Vibrio sp. qd031]ORT50294.1 XRE family transcriptional regulator [Vibrio sp. qd031]